MRQDRVHIAVPGGRTPYPVYSRAERLADAVLHVLGILFALIAVPVMVTLAAVWHGDLGTVGAALVYGASLIAMFTLSACYHMVRHGRTKQILRRLDHAAIYVKIAGTYTPFAVLLAGDSMVPILAGIWGAALLGAVLKITVPGRLDTLSLALYLALGWGAVVLFGPVWNEIPRPTFMLMLAGGGLYTLGVVFLYWDRLRFHTAIWHAFVLAASFVFYFAILAEVSRLAPL
ncbi:MAG TPA: hemolysin III family protein [Thermohalobaculum sp.]|nr:hemolysin III family protein [Thermohalobaculum sp.]